MTASTTTEIDPDHMPVEVGGYRVVRLLERGERALTAVVHAAAETRVARVFSRACPTAAIDLELAAHDAIGRAHPALRRHAVVLEDLVTLRDGRLALLLPLVAGPRLDHALSTRDGQLALGEAVTLLAPLAIALDAAHEVGLTALGLRARDVRLSESGAPVITRVQDAVAGPVLPQRFRAREPGYDTDLQTLVELGTAIASAVPEAHQSALLAALRAPSRGQPLAHALFDCADPVPLRIEKSDPSGVGLRTQGGVESPPTIAPAAAWSPESVLLAPASTPSRETTLEGSAPRVSAVLDALRVLGLPASIIDPVHEAALGIVARSARIIAAGRAAMGKRGAERTSAVSPRTARVRLRFVLTGAGGAVALMIAIALLAGSGTSPAGGPAAEEPLPTQPGSSLSADGVEIDGSAAESMSDRSAPDWPSATEWPDIVGVMVERWLQCHRSDDLRGTGCIDRVAHRGSSAERLIVADDARHALLERWRTMGGDAVVVERMGGAVLIDLTTAGTTTASLLLVRSEAGWRVRDVIG